MSMQVVSYGGGTQSTALLVLAARGELDVQTFLFANVGQDSEAKHTLDYLEQVAKPFAAQHGIALHELAFTRKDGTQETLYQRMTKPGSKSIPIPVRLTSGAPAFRACTTDWKIKVIAKWLKQHGATPTDPACVSLGISRDESDRVKDSQIAWIQNRFPLLFDYSGDEVTFRAQMLSRADCMHVIESAGLPLPGKSACSFCPYTKMREWREMRKNDPTEFERVARLEELMNERRTAKGKVYLTDKLMPLRQAVTLSDQGNLFEAEPSCDSGFCFM